MDENQFYCKKQGHSKTISFTCINKECLLSCLCCNSCISNIHHNHSKEDFISIEPAFFQGIKLKIFCLKLLESLKQMFTNYLKEIKELIEKYDMQKDKFNLSQLESLAKEMKTGNLMEKVNIIQNCLKDSENDIRDSFTNIIEYLTLKNPIAIEGENYQQTEHQYSQYRRIKIKPIIQDTQMKTQNYNYQLTSKQKGHSKGVKCLSISKDDQLMASSGLDYKIILWNINDLTRIGEYQGINITTSLIFAPNNEILIGGEYDNILLFKLNTANLKPFQILRNHKYIITTFAITQDSRYLISGSWDKTIKIWSLEYFNMIHTYNYSDHISGLALSDNQQYLGCYGPSDEEASLFDCSKIEKLTKLTSWKIPKSTNCMEFTPGSSSLLTTGIGSVQIWNVKSLLKNGTAKLIRQLNEFSLPYSKLSHDGQTLCCCDSSRLFIFNYLEFKLICSFQVELRLLPFLVLSSDMRSILSILATSEKEICKFERV